MHTLSSPPPGPTNGIQRTPFATWLKQANTAGYNVVWAPLSAESKKTFDAKAAFEFWKEHEGLNYGFGTLLVGWVDTTNDNFPCLPPYPDAQGSEGSWCLTWDLVQVLFPLVGKLGKWAVEQVWLEGFNHRVGVNATGPLCEGCLDTLSTFYQAEQNGLAVKDLWSVPESDAWQYSQM